MVEEQLSRNSMAQGYESRPFEYEKKEGISEGVEAERKFSTKEIVDILDIALIQHERKDELAIKRRKEQILQQMGRETEQIGEGAKKLEALLDENYIIKTAHGLGLSAEDVRRTIDLYSPSPEIKTNDIREVEGNLSLEVKIKKIKADSEKHYSKYIKEITELFNREGMELYNSEEGWRTDFYHRDDWRLYSNSTKLFLKLREVRKIRKGIFKHRYKEKVFEKEISMALFKYKKYLDPYSSNKGKLNIIVDSPIFLRVCGEYIKELKSMQEYEIVANYDPEEKI